VLASARSAVRTVALRRGVPGAQAVRMRSRRTFPHEEHDRPAAPTDEQVAAILAGHEQILAWKVLRASLHRMFASLAGVVEAPYDGGGRWLPPRTALWLMTPAPDLCGAGVMLNESQQRYLLSRLRSIEEMLSEAAEQLEPREESRVFTRIDADATSSQRKTLADFLGQLRFALRRFMLSQALHDEGRRVSGLWSFRTSISFAQIAAEELRPSYWRGYGEVDPEAAGAAERCAAELATLLRRLEDYIVRGDAGSLTARLAKLDATRDELALLRELERVISAYGLTELRAPLENLIDRASAPRFEIAVFGRVSAGKSSLLNWWLEQTLLPTGVTPVTSVPVRIVQGERTRIRIRRASGAPVDVELDELAAYATEQGNPGNAKAILEIVIQAPSERLRGGVCLVDTPGLGSLATAGAAQTLEYLPRCDLGILLVNAGAPVTQEDLDVARALLDGGSDLLMIASKADQLSASDLGETVTYVREQFEERLGMPVSVHPVSTLTTHSSLTTEWFGQEIAPRLARHAEQAAQSLKRKIAVLRESVITVLEARLRSEAEPAAGSREPQSATPADVTLRDRIGQVRSDLEYTRTQLLDLRLRLGGFADAVVGSASEELARCWLSLPRAEPTLAQRVEGAMLQRADEAGAAVAHMLHEMFERMAHVLKASGCNGEALDELGRPRGRPIIDLSLLGTSSHYNRPAWLPRLSFLAHALAAARMRRTMWAPIEAQLGLYGEALCHWGTKYVNELDMRFEAAVAAREGRERFASEAALAVGSARAAREDLERLRRWSGEAMPGTTVPSSEQPA